MTQASIGTGMSGSVNRFQTKAKPRGWPSRGSIVHCLVGLAGRLGDLLALVEGAEHDDAALPGVEGLAERLLRLDGLCPRVDRPGPPPVPRVGKPPAHFDHPPLARFGIPRDDRQQATHAKGDDLVVAAFARFAVAAAAPGEGLRERNDFGPGRQGRELAAHGETVASAGAGK
jgi:hypothetical protein